MSPTMGDIQDENNDNHDQNDDNNAKKRKLDEKDTTRPRMTFRSYKPNDEELKKVVLEPAKPLEVKEQVKEQLEAAKEKTIIEEVDLVNIVPQKPDADLKRDVQKRLDKLERRTNRALAELMTKQTSTTAEERIQSKKMTIDEVEASLALNPTDSQL